jgi:hypothetical protein
MFSLQEITSGLVGQWKVNEGSGTTINDSSGNGHHGSLSVSNGIWQSSGGIPMNVSHPPLSLDEDYFKFDGDLITITGSGTHADFQMVKDFSLMCWVNPLSITIHKGIVCKGHGNSYWGLVFGSTTYIQFAYSNGSGNKNITPMKAKYSMENAWQHVGVSLDDATPAAVTFWVNGIASSPKTLNYDIVAHSRDFVIGGNTSDSSFDGGIADVRLYNRQLSEAEWRRIYEHAAYLKKVVVV